MPESKLKQLLSELRKGLEGLYRDRLEGIYLFGSYARGEATVESDVDILIVLEQVADYGSEIKVTGHLISALSLDFDVSISRVFVSSSAWQERDSPFLSNVRRHAKAA